jgi:peptidoglycan hydrolase-like protein with peptidoglycan-binding domain
MRNYATAFIGSMLLLMLITTTGNAVATTPETATVSVPQCTDANPGVSVREVQCLLNLAIDPATFPPIPEDGLLGPNTVNKIKKFQQCANARGAGLVVDGRIGPRTVAELEYWANSGSYVC